MVILANGDAAAFVERGGRSIITFPCSQESDAWIEGLTSLVKDGRFRSLEIAKIDGSPVRESRFANALRAHGFTDSYRGLSFRG